VDPLRVNALRAPRIVNVSFIGPLLVVPIAVTRDGTAELSRVISTM
jgi:hypothetical protein